jgi:hypothetical protein
MSLCRGRDDPADIRFEERQDRLADEYDERERDEAESAGAERMRADVLRLIDREWATCYHDGRMARMFDRLTDKIKEL